MTAAQAAELTRVELWSVGKSLLLEQKMPRAQCGTFVGKLVKDYDEETVLAVLRDAVVQRPADAASWLVAACKQRKSPRRGTLTAEQQHAESQAKADRILAAMDATGGALVPAASLELAHG